MTTQVALSLATQAMITAAKIAAPILLSTMAVGLLVSLFQAVTQINEMTLTFVPKVLVVGLVIAVGGHWMLDQFIAFVHQLFTELPELLKGG